ncbi:ATP-binding cassette domain-containing protein [Natronohydrobacter thiooxidans]|uniref:ATP-binding cassette domain-containing protein n=1 Tax=Natronohydrobacter thiooxidans TaxID=87172 RepID=UPI0008FF22CD|nr:ATP-binding cassette domain-containing protein [Natronohydrobacter thiooxidans]
MSLRLDRLEIARAGAVMVRLDREIAPGAVLSVMGPSGCGKSTLLAALVGALPGAFAMRGRVWLEGRDVTALPPHRRRMGMLFQDDLLFPHLSVAGNLGFGLARGVADRAGVIDAALREAGLEGMGGRDPATLSGGQRARVALMRVLLSEPRALLLDEPFAKLDAGLRAQMREFVFARARARGLPVVLVTHDLADARAAGGAVVNVSGEVLGL